MRRAPVTVVLLAALGLGAEPARAYLQTLNQPLDRALWPEHEAPWVVSVRLRAVHRQEPAIEGPEVRAVEVDVVDVLLGPEPPAGRRLRLDVASFAWPDDLAPLEARSPLVLLLDRRGGEDATHIRTVVPVRDRRFERAADRGAVKRVLAGEILALLAASSGAVRKRHLILQAAPILTAAEAEALHPYLGSEDPWLRRAALSGLVLATRRAGYVDLAALDIRRFLETTDPRASVPDPRHPGISHAPRALLAQHYPMLQVGWSPEDRIPEFLPLWRAAAAASGKGDVTWRWLNGVRALAEVGTEEDLPLLWSAWEEAREEVPFLRQGILLGLARILGVKLPSRSTDEYVRHEPEDLERVRAAARAR